MRTEKEVWVIEKRDANGALDFSEPQPPQFLMSEQQIFDWWFREHPEAETSIPFLDIFNIWLPSNGFTARIKTW